MIFNKNKAKNIQYHIVGSNKKIIVERSKLDTPNHDHSRPWLGKGTSKKSGWVKLVLWPQTSPLREITIFKDINATFLSQLYYENTMDDHRLNLF